MNNSQSSNSTNLAFAEEESLKVLPGTLGADAVWYGLEPNTYADMGATLSTVARTPITNTRQRSKGTTTDLDAKAGFNSDLTQRNLTRLLQGFFFADAIEKMATNRFNSAAIAITSVDITSGNHYNAVAGLDGFIVGHLVKAKNFGVSTNNGVKRVTAAAAGILSVSEVLAVEAGPPAAATLEAIGYQFPASDLVLTIVGATVVLTSAAKDPRTFGLTPGEWVYVGGDGAAEAYATGTTFFGRVLSVSATKIIFDLIVGAPVADVGNLKTIRIFFGKVVMNAVDPTDIVRRSYQLERQLGNDDDGIQSELVIGAVPNEITLNTPTAGKVTLDMTFVGMDVEYRTGADDIKDGDRVAAPSEEAINTSSDLVSSRISVIDPASPNPDPLFAYATELKLTVKNNVTGNKALGVLGSFEANVGEFDVSGTCSAYFQTVQAAQAIRDNSDVCLTNIFAKSNAGMVIDLPLLTLGNGLNKVEKDKPIMVELTQEAAKNAAGYTALWNFFEYLPDAAMPA